MNLVPGLKKVLIIRKIYLSAQDRVNIEIKNIDKNEHDN